MSRFLAPLDAVWLRMETSRNPMVVTAVLRLGGPLAPDRLRDLLAERLVARWPRFRDRLVRGPRPRWEAVQVDLDHHLQVVALGGRTLEDLVGERMNEPLDPRRPPWRVHLVQGARAALVWRLHHCLADGIALARILQDVTDEGAWPIAPNWARPLLPSAASRLEAGLEAGAHLLLMPPDPPTPLLGRPGSVKRARWADPVPTDDVRRVAHAFGATVNDVLLAAVAGGLHRWLRSHGAPVDHLRAMVPVSLRPLDRPLSPDLGNRFSVVFVPLPVGIADPVVRLRTIHRHTARLRDGAEAAVGRALLEAAGAAPPAVELAALEVFGHKASLVCSNVPGPAAVVHLAGVPVEGVLFFAPHVGDVGLSVSLFSYGGEVTVGVAVDGDRIPDPERLLVGVREDLDDLVAELVTR